MQQEITIAVTIDSDGNYTVGYDAEASATEYVENFDSGVSIRTFVLKLMVTLPAVDQFTANLDCGFPGAVTLEAVKPSK